MNITDFLTYCNNADGKSYSVRRSTALKLITFKQSTEPHFRVDKSNNNKDSNSKKEEYLAEFGTLYSDAIDINIDRLGALINEEISAYIAETPELREITSDQVSLYPFETKPGVMSIISDLILHGTKPFDAILAVFLPDEIVFNDVERDESYPKTKSL